MSATTYEGALDANPKRVVIQSELLAAVDPATLAADLDSLSDRNPFTDADKAAVAALARYKGEYVDLAALEAAHPAASVTQSDAWAQLEGSDSFAILDNATGAWVQSTSPPASIDTSLNAGSTNAVTNQAITNALAAKLKMAVIAIPGDGVLTNFTINHGITNVAMWSLRKQATKEQVGIKIVASTGTNATVGPFATAPADGTVFEMVCVGI